MWYTSQSSRPKPPNQNISHYFKIILKKTLAQAQKVFISFSGAIFLFGRAKALPSPWLATSLHGIQETSHLTLYMILHEHIIIHTSQTHDTSYYI